METKINMTKVAFLKQLLQQRQADVVIMVLGERLAIWRRKSRSDLEVAWSTQLLETIFKTNLMLFWF
jgi:UDP-2,3-diacylglucosamine pyrophosphatase LpxH